MCLRKPHSGAHTCFCTQRRRQNTIAGGSCLKYHFCRDKGFVVTNMCLLRQNTSSVMTKVCLPRQTCVCRDKHFVATSILLSRQQTCFVVTKIILVAAPTNDRILHTVCKRKNIMCVKTPHTACMHTHTHSETLLATCLHTVQTKGQMNTGNIINNKILCSRLLSGTSVLKQILLVFQFKAFQFLYNNNNDKCLSAIVAAHLPAEKHF